MESFGVDLDFAIITFSINAFDIPIELIGYAALSVLRITTLETLQEYAADKTFSVPNRAPAPPMKKYSSAPIGYNNSMSSPRPMQQAPVQQVPTQMRPPNGQFYYPYEIPKDPREVNENGYMQNYYGR